MGVEMGSEFVGGTAVRLTPAEHRVLEHVLEGQSNKEIALCLSCSPRTVEFHLARIFRKTGMESRARLISAIANGHIRADAPAAPSSSSEGAGLVALKRA